MIFLRVSPRLITHLWVLRVSNCVLINFGCPARFGTYIGANHRQLTWLALPEARERSCPERSSDPALVQRFSAYS